MGAGSDLSATVVQWCRKLERRPVMAYAGAVIATGLAVAIDTALSVAGSTPVPHLILGQLTLIKIFFHERLVVFRCLFDKLVMETVGFLFFGIGDG